MLCNIMQNKLLGTDADLEKDWFIDQGHRMAEPNASRTEKQRNSITFRILSLL